jgi:hypothetical protein
VRSAKPKLAEKSGLPTESAIAIARRRGARIRRAAEVVLLAHQSELLHCSDACPRQLLDKTS